MALLTAVTLYWNAKSNEKLHQLRVIAQGFLDKCNSGTGCQIAPPGWEPMRAAYRLNDDGGWVKSSDTASFQGDMEYVANAGCFELRWHIATDIYLVARGGVGRELITIRVVS